jgi:hypothetical protein
MRALAQVKRRMAMSELGSRIHRSGVHCGARSSIKGTLMRHFMCATLTPGALARGMTACSTGAELIALPGAQE